MTLQDQWRTTWRDLGLPEPAADVLQALLARYGEAHRAYHTAQHLAECFARFAAARPLAAHPGEVQLALWYHDAIYDPHSTRNEADSAAWAARVLAAAGAAPEVVQRIGDLILATRHRAEPATADARLTVDIDLSILGAPPDRFAEYERQIRVEYGFVPEADFRSARARILRGFLERPAIYGTAFFHQALERPARENLQRSLGQLGA